MSIRQLIEALVAKGIDAIDAAEIVTSAAIEGAKASSVDKAAEKRRAYDRNRKREQRQSPVENADKKPIGQTADNPPIPPDVGWTPVESSGMRDIDNNTSLSEVPKKTIPQRASYPPDFSELWELFPRKVGKDEALRAFKRVKGRVGLETLKTAVSKHAALCAGKEKQFIPHPATWLNDGRWQDEELQLPKPLALVSGNKQWVAYGTDQWNAWVAHRKHMGVPPINPNNGGFWFPSEWPPTPAMRRTG